MIEKIKDEEYKFISEPNIEVVETLEKITKSSKEPIAVGEIGIGVGATAVEIVRFLGNKDSYYFFSYEDDVKELEKDLKNLDYCKCKLYPMGNTKTIYDSYNWKLGLLYRDTEDLFDLVYLDGAHTFLHDGLATALLKKLVKPGGYIIFDDLNWSYKKAPDLNPEIRPETLKEFSEEQIETEQVNMIIDVFMKTDNEWELIVKKNNSGVYRKKPKSSTENEKNNKDMSRKKPKSFRKIKEPKKLNLI